MFYDSARIFVRSGNGGDGMISFRREKFVPRGGPDGGDGGHGGNVIFVVNPKINSLVTFHRQVHFEAGNGVHGGRSDRTGAMGETLRLEVPPGTVIRDAETDDLLADLVHPEQEVMILVGGRGGKGNARYASSVNQTPRLAERGAPGEAKWLTLELKLIADVGLVGMPNAGKSTLLSVISAAKPKIAPYPFTTLEPNLGVVQLDEYQTMVVADIPGLIKGAAEGVGLGHEFLRHIERTRVLIHLLDGAAAEPLEDWATINQELSFYDPALMGKPQLVVLNKMDLPDAVAWEPIIQEKIEAEGYEFCAIAAATGQNVRPMLYKVWQMLQDLPPVIFTPDEQPIIRPEMDEDDFTIERESGGWRVHGIRIERIAAMTYFEFEATARRFQSILEDMGISDALRKAGVQDGDTVYIGDEVLEWSNR